MIRVEWMCHREVWMATLVMRMLEPLLKVATPATTSPEASSPSPASLAVTVRRGSVAVRAGGVGGSVRVRDLKLDVADTLRHKRVDCNLESNDSFLERLLLPLPLKLQRLELGFSHRNRVLLKFLKLCGFLLSLVALSCRKAGELRFLLLNLDFQLVEMALLPKDLEVCVSQRFHTLLLKSDLLEAQMLILLCYAGGCSLRGGVCSRCGSLLRDPQGTHSFLLLIEQLLGILSVWQDVIFGTSDGRGIARYRGSGRR